MTRRSLRWDSRAIEILAATAIAHEKTRPPEGGRVGSAIPSLSGQSHEAIRLFSVPTADCVDWLVSVVGFGVAVASSAEVVLEAGEFVPVAGE